MDKELVVFVSRMTLGIVMVLIVSVVIGLSLDSIGCNKYSADTGRVTKYDIWNGCFVKSNNGLWFSTNNLNSINLENK